MPNELFVLILAGGSGERFWPLSRRAAPKQLLNLFSEQTLLENTVQRLEGLVPAGNILILTNREQEAAVRRIITTLPTENIIAEPDKRDTAAAIALGVGIIARRDHSATMVVLPADHLIQNSAAFQNDLRLAAQAAETSEALITIGIKPTWACPGFGYIEQGNAAFTAGQPVFDVVRFREKPAPDLAETFLRQGNFRWNAGMFIWTIPAILREFERSTPHLCEFILRMQKSADIGPFLDREFSVLPKISIDYAILEKAQRVLVVEASFDWDDVGGWLAVANYLPHDELGNRANTGTTTSQATNNIVYSNTKKHVALLGVSDLVVVETADALLIVSRHEAENIKHLIKEIPSELQ